MFGVPIVVLAKILRKILFGMPIDVMSPAPDPRVRLRIIDRRFILQRVVVRTRDPLNQMERIGMRQAEACHPELLVKPTVSITSVSPSQWPTECPRKPGSN